MTQEQTERLEGQIKQLKQEGYTVGPSTEQGLFMWSLRKGIGGSGFVSEYAAWYAAWCTAYPHNPPTRADTDTRYIVQVSEKGKTPHSFDIADSQEEAVRIADDYKADGSPFVTCTPLNLFMKANGYDPINFTDDDVSAAVFSK